jgi:ADP-ribosylglycohydrolase
MKKLLILALSVWSAAVSAGCPDRDGSRREIATLSRAALLDKIRGGWAGQVIGCTFGGPTEFVFNSTIIPDHQPILWSGEAIRWCFDNQPGLYDDVYMDLTFVEVLEESGLDAPAAAFAAKFARADYPLWHANQMARYNILNGIAPPRSGHWLNNPHADDIDFQIEADFVGLMSPGMVGAAAGVCDRVGHIMNSGDGYYGGLFVAAMYALAFVESDVHEVVGKALAVIPSGTDFARTVGAVIDGHALYPADWQRTWFEVERRWGADRGCPEGVFRPFNIDARMNAAWAVLGLLYGDGDFGKTLEVSARAGDDSDCNPATSGGVLGTILGLDRIPGGWKAGLESIRDRDFPYTGVSLDEAGELSFKHALETIKRRGGSVGNETVQIPVAPTEPAPLEAAFVGHFPAARRRLGLRLDGSSPEARIQFGGIGLAINGEVAAGVGERGNQPGGPAEAVVVLEARVDDGPAETVNLPFDPRTRKPTLFWKYRLDPGEHLVRLKILEAAPGTEVRLHDIVIYADEPPIAGSPGAR